MSESERTTGTEWKWIRNEVIIRDDYECQECGSLGGRKGDTELHVHHIEQVQDSGSDDRDNLITLCAECHVLEHSTEEDDTSSHYPSPAVVCERDEDSGRYTAKYAEEDILDTVREHAPAATREVAEAVGFARQNAGYRLRRFADEGKVRRKKVGPTLVWLPAEESCEP